jgi:hypothetical protein
MIAHAEVNCCDAIRPRGEYPPPPSRAVSPACCLPARLRGGHRSASGAECGHRRPEITRPRARRDGAGNGAWCGTHRPVGCAPRSRDRRSRGSRHPIAKRGTVFLGDDGSKIEGVGEPRRAAFDALQRVFAGTFANSATSRGADVAPPEERSAQGNTDHKRSRPGVIRTHDQGIMRTKAHPDEVIRKTERFPVPPVQACGFGKKTGPRHNLPGIVCKSSRLARYGANPITALTRLSTALGTTRPRLLGDGGVTPTITAGETPPDSACQRARSAWR